MDLPCVLCRSKDVDESIFGKVHYHHQLQVHRNCLYLSSELSQNGNDSTGIFRFVQNDIVNEIRRCSGLRCCYCQRRGANIDCCHRECPRSFHTKCGFDNLAVSQFSGTYNSYCDQHVPEYSSRPRPEELCMICFEALVAEGSRFSLARAVQSPCCQNGWYHRRCLQLYATSAGSTFKCPLCNNVEKFAEVALFGIWISPGDASWELEPIAFDQLQREQRCTATKCRVRPAARRTGDGAVLLRCIMCGSNPMHTACTSKTASTYRCADCIVVETSVATGSAAERRRLFHPISPRATAARSNIFAGESRRRRTWAHSNATEATPEPSNTDESCVARRTRSRLQADKEDKK